MSATALSDLLSITLANVETCLTANSLPLPANRYVIHNSPAWDCCDLLTVDWAMGKASRTVPSQSSSALRCGTVPVFDIRVTLLRCVPALALRDSSAGVTGVLPDPAAMDVESKLLADDAWVLFDCVLCKLVSNNFLPTGYTLGSMGGITPLGPQGECAGSRLSFSIELDQRVATS